MRVNVAHCLHLEAELIIGVGQALERDTDKATKLDSDFAPGQAIDQRVVDLGVTVEADADDRPGVEIDLAAAIDQVRRNVGAVGVDRNAGDARAQNGAGDDAIVVRAFVVGMVGRADPQRQRIAIVIGIGERLRGGGRRAGDLSAGFGRGRRERGGGGQDEDGEQGMRMGDSAFWGAGPPASRS